MTYTEKCRWLADFYTKAADEGRGKQFRRASKWEDTLMGPCMDSDPEQWRLKPEPPKAWVVWDENQCRMISSIKPDAEDYAKRINGTIQQITRPD
jgi:hypothetical protein